jgi:hypothetical protein
MNFRNLFIFVITHVKQLGGNGRGVVIVRNTSLTDISNEFDTFLQTDEIKQHVQYKKEKDDKYPDMVVYRANSGEEHIVFGKSEQGWKGDYGLTHTDFIVSIH